jgi:hypothetical protein
MVHALALLDFASAASSVRLWLYHIALARYDPRAPNLELICHHPRPYAGLDEDEDHDCFPDIS